MESTSNTCCSADTCCGMKMEKGCLIFSIMNISFCSVCTLGSLGFLGLVVSTWFDGDSRGPNDMVLVWFFLGISLACCVGSIVAMAFAVVLYLGVRKNKPLYIMEYLVYGIVVVALSELGTFSFIWMEWGNTPIVTYALIPLGICVLYSGLLVLVYRTYAVLAARARARAMGAPHKRLLNHDDF